MRINSSGLLRKIQQTNNKPRNKQLSPFSSTSSTLQHASDKPRIYALEKLPSQQRCPGTASSLSFYLFWGRSLTYLAGTWCCWPCSAWLVKASHVFSCLLHVCRCFSHWTGSLNCPPDDALMLISKAVLKVRTQHRTRRGLNFATTAPELWNCKTSLGIYIWNEATISQNSPDLSNFQILYHTQMKKAALKWCKKHFI